jgi:hypothetical protein
MSIKLRLEKGAIVLQAILADEAFAELLTIIQTHESKDTGAATSTAMGSLATPLPLGDGVGDPSQSTKTWLSGHSGSEVLNMLRWAKNPDKILLLGAHYEARGGAEGWRNADMVSKFAEAKEAFPGNFSRDVVVAIRDGLLATVTPRTYKVSRTGWNKITEAVGKISH